MVLTQMSSADTVFGAQKLRGDLGIDSLKMVELILALEEEFGFEIDESDLDPSRFLLVSDLYKLMTKYVGK